MCTLVILTKLIPHYFHPVVDLHIRQYALGVSMYHLTSAGSQSLLVPLSAGTSFPAVTAYVTELRATFTTEWNE